MAINFNNLQNRQVDTLKSEQREQIKQQETNVRQATAQQESPKTKQDSVSITPQAQQFTKLQQKASNTSDIDQGKISQIKKAISEGRYEIDVERLAQKLANFESDLL
jgi:negative regulator of flagellin synthesis FlgM